MPEAPAAGSSINAELPAEVDLREIALSFKLPKGKNLSRTWSRELRTEVESTLALRVSADRLSLQCAPPLLIDALWPAKNMVLSGATLQFANAKIDILVAPVSGVGEGLVDFTSKAQEELLGMLRAGLGTSAMATAGYNPFTDTALIATLSSIADNFQRQPASGTSDVSTADLGEVAVEATIALRTAFTHSEGGSGLAVPEGGVLRVRVAGAGNLAQIASASTTADRLRAANIQSVTLQSDALSVLLDGSALADLRRVRVDRGGRVSIERIALHGGAEQAADLESLIRVIASAVSLAQRGIAPETALLASASSPGAEAEIIPGLTRGAIENALTKGVQTLIRDNRAALPGIDLGELLGV
jgi:hypothetical protein